MSLGIALPNLWKVTIKDFAFSQVAIPKPAALLKNELFHQCFSSNIFPFFRSAILWNTFEWLFLRAIVKSYQQYTYDCLNSENKVNKF